jgi:hypothetical protein
MRAPARKGAAQEEGVTTSDQPSGGRRGLEGGRAGRSWPWRRRRRRTPRPRPKGLLLVTITLPRFARWESVRPIERPSPTTASRPRRTALSRWSGAGHCGPTGRRYRVEACEGRRPAPVEAAAQPPSVAADRPGRRRGASTPDRLATQPRRRPRAHSSPRSRPGRQAVPRPEGAPAKRSASTGQCLMDDS